MAMIACRECGLYVSRSAKACPYCGISRPGNALSLTMVIVLVIVVGGIAAAVNSHTPQTPLPRETAAMVDQASSNQPLLSRPAPAQQSASQVEPPRCTATMSDFSSIKTDMTYRRVASIIGCEGEETTRSEVGDYQLVAYIWPGNSFASNMSAVFQNGRLVSKAQIGLK
jgi:RNA polymerase subunit RPABC4/transcription elongation factor Spt4